MAYMLKSYAFATSQNATMVADNFLCEWLLYFSTKGWTDNKERGGLVSPDNSSIFIYSNSKHKAELMQYKRGMKKEFEELAKQLIDSKHFVEVFDAI